MNTSHNFYPLIAVLCALLLIIYIFDINISLFLMLNKAAQYIPITWWGYITYLGDGIAAGCILGIIFRKNPNAALIGILAVLISGVIVQLLKDFFSIQRPAGILELKQFYQLGEIFTSRALPSGHSATSFSLFGTLMYNQNNNKLLFLGLAILIAFSRIAIGMHWPMDILSGAIIGIITTYILSIKLKNNTPKNRVQLYIGIFLGLICISALFYNARIPKIQILQWGLGITGIICIISKFYTLYKVNLSK